MQAVAARVGCILSIAALLYTELSLQLEVRWYCHHQHDVALRWFLYTCQYSGKMKFDGSQLWQRPADLRVSQCGYMIMRWDVSFLGHASIEVVACTDSYEILCIFRPAGAAKFKQGTG